MIQTTYDLPPNELFRLCAAFAAIRNPTIREEFLELVEAWSQDQWNEVDKAAQTKKAGSL